MRGSVNPLTTRKGAMLPFFFIELEFIFEYNKDIFESISMELSIMNSITLVELARIKMQDNTRIRYIMHSSYQLSVLFDDLGHEMHELDLDFPELGEYAKTIEAIELFMDSTGSDTNNGAEVFVRNGQILCIILHRHDVKDVYWNSNEERVEFNEICKRAQLEPDQRDANLIEDLSSDLYAVPQFRVAKVAINYWLHPQNLKQLYFVDGTPVDMDLVQVTNTTDSGVRLMVKDLLMQHWSEITLDGTPLYIKTY